MRNWLLVVTAIAAAPGCGDNSRSCGDGTRVESGYCVPLTPDGGVRCGAGTALDPLTGLCQIDPAACQNGTVLIDSACVDPTVGTIVDLEEGPEPNGLGVIEASDARAGTIAIKDSGAFVIHGTIEPHPTTSGGLDPDVDTYVVTVTAPMLLHVTSDGVQGVNAGFVVTSADIAGWKRFGIDLAGDASQRQVFLPEAGTYEVSVADARTLFEYADSGTATSAPGPGEYYLSLTQVALPMPTVVSTSASGTLPGGEVGFYSTTISNGSHPITLAMPSTFALASLVVEANAFLAFDDEDSQPARLTASGLGTTLIVVDHVYDVSPAPLAFQLTIQ